MSEDPEMERLRQQRLAQLQQEARQKEVTQEIDRQRQAALMGILTDKARERLNNIKMARPELAATLENQLIQLAQAQRLREKITDSQLREMLRRATGQKRDTTITRVRK